MNADAAIFIIVGLIAVAEGITIVVRCVLHEREQKKRRIYGRFPVHGDE
jgi:hypothetical protein